MKKGLCIVLLLLSLTLLLAACAGRSDNGGAYTTNGESGDTQDVRPLPADDVRLRFGLWDEDLLTAIQPRLDAFTAETGIAVDVNVIPGLELYGAWLMAATGPGDVADVLLMDEQLPLFAERSVFLPLGSFAEQDGIVWDAVPDCCVYMETLFALPDPQSADTPQSFAMYARTMHIEAAWLLLKSLAGH